MAPALLSLLLAACIAPMPAAPAATPTTDPDIYNQLPDTTIFEPGQCSVVLDAATPAFTSSTLGGEPSGTIDAGTYEVGVAADYGSSLWYMLNGVGEVSFVNSANVASTEGDCSTAS